MRTIPIKSLISYLLALIILLPALHSCSKNEKYHIGVSQCSYDDWRLKLNDEIMREALLYDDLDVEIVSAYDNPERQEKDIRNFIEKGVDVIIASPQNDHDLNSVLNEAREKGIKVIVFDRDASEKCYDVFVGADNRELGLAAGEYLLSRLNGKGDFLEIRGTPASSPTAGRHEGFTQALAGAHEAKCVGWGYGEWNSSRAEVVADSLLRLYPDVKAVYAHNDRMALGVRAAADKLGKKDLLIAGTDAVPDGGIKAVAEGKIDATFMYPTAGKELVDLGHKAAKGEPLQDQLIISSALPVDHTNAEILLQLAQSIEDEKGKISFLQDRVDTFTTRHNEQRIILIVIGIAALLLAAVIFIMMRLIWQRHRHQIELETHYRRIEQQHDQLKQQRDRINDQYDQLKEQSEKIKDQHDHIKEQHDQLKEQRDDLERLNIRLQEATQSKLLFFTNVSHDLRTPLTLIAEPVRQLQKDKKLSDENKTLLKLADKNIRILNRLINQILDFRKFENGKLNLNRSEVDLRIAFSEWSDSFKMLAVRRDIQYNLIFGDMETATAAIDVEKMERIFFNIMSNAFKFTPVKGKIEAIVSTTSSSLMLKISDTGKGMDPDELSRIFDRFYQAENIKPGGSGIGLAVVKAFVELHEGSISVDSKPDAGSTFTVEIPITHMAASGMKPRFPSSENKEEIKAELENVNEESDTLIELDPDKPTILIIDDTNDMRTLLRISLRRNYNILEAPNGEHGVRIAAKYLPDVIICDLMMPGIGGQECCRRIKNEESTAHIPIIMLTACELDEQRCENLNAGVDVYMTKPFDAELLEAQCRSLIDNRKRIIERNGNDLPAAPYDTSRGKKINGQPDDVKDSRKVVHTSDGIENEFYTRFLEIVDSEIGNPDISIEEIGSRMGLSRVHFYRKIKSITGYSPVEILRTRRLKYAHRRLTSEDCTVAEVAYSVGFSSPSYFSRCFREQYGELPLDLQKRTSKMG